MLQFNEKLDEYLYKKYPKNNIKSKNIDLKSDDH